MTGGGVEWPQCDSEGCQDPDLELMISSLEKAVSSMQVGETDLLGVMNDVQRMRDVKSPYIYPPLTRIEPEQVIIIMIIIIIITLVNKNKINVKITKKLSKASLVLLNNKY